MKIDFQKGGGLVPAIVQDADTGTVLMLGYMNHAAYQKSLAEGLVTLYSRSRQKLWTKGETSGNYLDLVEILTDCDGDALLVLARPRGPVCHTGENTCFKQPNRAGITFLDELGAVIEQRRDEPAEQSYTASLLKEGVKKIAQKVGEESSELILEAVAGSEERFLEEAADLTYHLLVLLAARNRRLADVAAVLRARHPGTPRPRP